MGNQTLADRAAEATPERIKHTVYIYAAGCETTRECYCYASNGNTHHEDDFTWVPGENGSYERGGSIEPPPPTLTDPEHVAVVRWLAVEHDCEGRDWYGCRICYENAEELIDFMRDGVMFNRHPRSPDERTVSAAGAAFLFAALELTGDEDAWEIRYVINLNEKLDRLAFEANLTN